MILAWTGQSGPEIGTTPVGGLVPLSSQRWSPFRGAGGVSPSIPLIEWLVSIVSLTHAPIQFHPEIRQ